MVVLLLLLLVHGVSTRSPCLPACLPAVARLFSDEKGHFRLTSLLMPSLLKSPDARVVSVSSSAHLFAPTVEWDDLNAQAPGAYAPWKAYGLSKLSNIFFAKELQKRADLKGGE